jgi:hypothetical protein
MFYTDKFLQPSLMFVSKARAYQSFRITLGQAPGLTRKRRLSWKACQCVKHSSLLRKCMGEKFFFITLGSGNVSFVLKYYLPTIIFCVH